MYSASVNSLCILRRNTFDRSWNYYKIKIKIENILIMCTCTGNIFYSDALIEEYFVENHIFNILPAAKKRILQAIDAAKI
jgi:hypothetical protein